MCPDLLILGARSIRKAPSHSNNADGEASFEGNEYGTHNDPSLHRDVSNLQRFIATLSDQQLVTGPALLLAGYIKLRGLSLYHFNIIASVAWFSAAVHWMALSTLQIYFIGRMRALYWRLIWLVLFLGLLIVAQFATVSNIDQSYAVACVFRGYGSLSHVEIGTGVVSVLYAVDLYVDAIMSILLSDLSWSWSTWLLVSTVNSILRFQERQRAKSIESSSSSNRKDSSRPRQIVAEAIQKRQEEEFERYTSHATRLSSSKGRRNVFVIFCAIIDEELRRSFLYKIFNAIFIFVYGTASTFMARRPDGLNIDGNQDTMGFGQIVPLLLLLLPVFSILDTFQGTRYRDGGISDRLPHYRNTRGSRKPGWVRCEQP